MVFTWFILVSLNILTGLCGPIVYSIFGRSWPCCGICCGTNWTTSPILPAVVIRNAEDWAAMHFFFVSSLIDFSLQQQFAVLMIWSDTVHFFCHMFPLNLFAFIWNATTEVRHGAQRQLRRPQSHTQRIWLHLYVFSSLVVQWNTSIFIRYIHYILVPISMELGICNKKICTGFHCMVLFFLFFIFLWPWSHFPLHYQLCCYHEVWAGVENRLALCTGDLLVYFTDSEFYTYCNNIIIHLFCNTFQ